MKNATFCYAFQKTLPIMAGFLFVGLTYGMYMHQLGFNFLFPTLMALTIFGGSVEFVIANLLIYQFNPWLVLFLTLVINSRHLFYGLSMLDKFKGSGLKKLYMIFGMCDESFSINFSTNVPAQLDRKTFFFYVTLLNHIYWVGGALIGGILANVMHLQLHGLSFVLNGMFITLCVSQFMHEKNHFSLVTGLMLALVTLFICGPTFFLLASMILMLGILGFKYREKKVDSE